MEAIETFSQTVEARKGFSVSYYGELFFSSLIDYCFCCLKTCLLKCDCYKRRRVNYEKFDLALDRLSQE